MGDTCYRIRDSGQDASELEDDEEGDGGSGGSVDAVLRSDASLKDEERDGGTAAALDAASLGGTSADAALDAMAPNIDSGAAQPDAGAGDASADGSVATRPCDPNPCQNGGTCASAGGGRTCDCSDGYMGANCELEICGDTPIRTPADVENNRLCGEIRGNLDISKVGLTEITADDFPFLEKVTGTLTISGVQNTASPQLQAVTLSKLRVVEGMIHVASLAFGYEAVGPFSTLRLPALTRAGGLRIEQSSVSVVELPVLETIDTIAVFNILSNLCALDIRKVARVNGNVQLNYVPRISARLFEPLRSAATGTVMQEQIGCCWDGVGERVSCAYMTGCAGCKPP
jgi:hypothetical protein